MEKQRAQAVEMASMASKFIGVEKVAISEEEREARSFFKETKQKRSKRKKGGSPWAGDVERDALIDVQSESSMVDASESSVRPG